MAYDIDKVVKIIADLQNDGLSEAEIRVRLAQAGLPDDVMDKALKTLAMAKAPVETPVVPSPVVSAPASLISKKEVIPEAAQPSANLIAKTPVATPVMPKPMPVASTPVVPSADTTNIGAIKAMVAAAPKPAVPVASNMPTNLSKLEIEIKDVKAHVAALQQITEQVLEANRNILVELRKK